VTVTYVDAGILIAVVRGDHLIADRALSVLEDAGRTFVACTFLRLELLPKALYHRNRSEAAFYRAFFSQVTAWAEPASDIVDLAERQAAQYGLNALDALHIAAATLLGADEFVTTEGLQKPIHRVTDVPVTMI
jgi:predicted nucleic acid-binding protein